MAQCASLVIDLESRLRLQEKHMVGRQYTKASYRTHSENTQRRIISIVNLLKDIDSASPDEYIDHRHINMLYSIGNDLIFELIHLEKYTEEKY